MNTAVKKNNHKVAKIVSLSAATLLGIGGCFAIQNSDVFGGNNDGTQNYSKSSSTNTPTQDSNSNDKDGKLDAGASSKFGENDNNKKDVEAIESITLPQAIENYDFSTDGTETPDRDGDFVRYSMSTGSTQDGRKVYIFTPTERIQNANGSTSTRPVDGGQRLVVDENGDTISNPTIIRKGKGNTQRPAAPAESGSPVVENPSGGMETPESPVVENETPAETPGDTTDTPVVEDGTQTPENPDTPETPVVEDSESTENPGDDTPITEDPVEDPVEVLVEYFDKEAFEKATADWQERMDAANSANDETQADLIEKQAAYTTAADAADKAQKSYDEAVSKLDELNSRLDNTAAGRVSELEGRVSELKGALDTANENLTKAQNELTVAARKNSEAKANLNNSQDTLNTKRSELTQAQKNQAKAQAALDSADTSLSNDDMLLTIADAVGERINEYRVKNGLHPLVFEVNLNRKAADWSDKNAAKGELSHSPRSEYGYSGENVLMNGTSCAKPTVSRADCADAMFRNWMFSDGHNRNMLTEEYTHAGIGVAVSKNGRYYATTMFFSDSVRTTDGFSYNSPGLKDATTDGYLPDGAIDLLGGSDYVVPVDSREKTDYSIVKGGRDAVDHSKEVEKGINPDISMDDTSALKAELEAAKKATATAQAKVDSAQAKVNTDKAEADMASGNLKKAEGNVSEAEKTVESTEKDLESTTRELDQAKADADSAEEIKKEISDQNEVVDGAKSELNEANSVRDKAQTKRDEAQKKADETQEKVDEVKAEEPKKEDFTREVTQEEFDRLTAEENTPEETTSEEAPAEEPEVSDNSTDEETPEVEALVEETDVEEAPAEENVETEASAEEDSAEEDSAEVEPSDDTTSDDTVQDGEISADESL